MQTDWKQWEDLNPEDEARLIEKLAWFFVRRNLGFLAKMTLESGGTLTSLFAEFYMGIYGPYFDFLGVDRYVALLRKKKNSVRVVERIEAIEKDLEEKAKASKQQPSPSSPVS